MIVTTLKFTTAPIIFLLGCVVLVLSATVAFIVKKRYTSAHEIS